MLLHNSTEFNQKCLKHAFNSVKSLLFVTFALEEAEKFRDYPSSSLHGVCLIDLLVGHQSSVEPNLLC